MDVDQIIDNLEAMSEDEDLPKSVAQKIGTIITDLKNTEELGLTVNKSVAVLEDLSEDVNIPAFVRTELWAVMSQLAALEADLMKE